MRAGDILHQLKSRCPLQMDHGAKREMTDDGSGVPIMCVETSISSSGKVSEISSFYIGKAAGFK